MGSFGPDGSDMGAVTEHQTCARKTRREDTQRAGAFTDVLAWPVLHEGHYQMGLYLESVVG